MVNCRKCKRNDPLNLVCFDQKCGAQQNLNLICCTCHSPLIHHTISINMFLDIAFIATQSWIDSKDQTTRLMDEIDKLVIKLQEKKAKMSQFLSYYDKNKQRYQKLQNMIQEFRYQICDSTCDDQDEFEDAFKEIKNHFNYVPNNSRQPMKLNAEQSFDVIQTGIQESLDEFSRNYLQVLEIREEDLRQLLQQQVQSQQMNSYNQNGSSNHNSSNGRNGQAINQKGNSSNIANNQKATSNQSTSSQNNKKLTSNQSTLQQQISSLYEPKEMLDYDELFAKNCIDIGFKVVPKYVEERKNIEKSSVEGKSKLAQDDSNRNTQNSNNNSTSFSAAVSQSLKNQKMEIEQNGASPLNNQLDQDTKKDQLIVDNSMDIEKSNEQDQQAKQQKQDQQLSLNINNNSNNKNEKEDASQTIVGDKQILSIDEERGKTDSIQFFDTNMKQLSQSFQKNTHTNNNNSALQQQQQNQQGSKLEKKILTRSASATNNSQPTSLTIIPQQSTNISPEKEKNNIKPQEKQPVKEKEDEKLNSQKKVESSSNISQSSKQNLEQKPQTSLPRAIVHSRKFRLNEDDQDLSSNKQKSNNSSDDEDEDNEILKSQSYPSGKKPKYIKKYDRKGQDYLKTLTEEQIDELIVDYNNLKNWREVEKKWGISKYHIIKFFKEQNYIIGPDDGEIIQP